MGEVHAAMEGRVAKKSAAILPFAVTDHFYLY
jgi:hypothetical protein